MKQTRGFAVAVAVTTILTVAPDVQARGTIPSEADAEVTFTNTGHGVRCGDTLTTNTLLSHDLNCPSSAPFALQIDGDGIVLDLGGHTIRRTGPANNDSQGIVIARGRMVRNGTVQGFGRGVTTTDSANLPSVRLHKLALLDNTAGVHNNNYANFLITDCRLSGNNIGLSSEFDASNGSFDVRSSVFTHNGIAMFADFHDIDALDSTFTSNGRVFYCWQGVMRFRSSTIAWNDAVGTIPNDGDGPRFCSEMRFENTLIANNAAFAQATLPVWQPFKLSMIDSLVVHNGTGLQASTLSVYIDGNTFHDNASGLTLADREGFPTGPMTGIVRGNQFLANDGDGLRVQPPSTPSVINNLALNNTGFGIYAPTAYDGGGNVARNNTAGNCVGIVCATY
ncbi:right-handed parallel beta-helix repeat-containing protein [Corallococcus sp. AS-1-12]|uniref:right-handed parallel beta-helix repeat-containing protein n=1 Tax=Corallococcus sp. AS-1-12 TaxID=2874598 RepID=UPI001CBEE60B|nr:right-handed parallel beta-helix repeat-containing protein [Corallococcus sp. AS-1-12]MBZ4329349.1 right-handed parallel beta-helix repeat-containing protein [Corallococcus sp. AS-1-12]